MKIHASVLLVLAIVLPIAGVAGCQIVKDLLRDPGLPDDLASLADSVLACVPLAGDPTPELAAKCIGGAVKTAAALADRGETVIQCAHKLREAEAGDKAALAEAEQLLADLEQGGSESGD